MFKVFIDPRAKISYASYYIFGLYRLFGKRNVRFSMKYFRDLKQANGVDDFEHYFAFAVTEKREITKRIVIDYRDKNTINKDALEWCDVYGKVNYNSKTEEFTALPGNLKDKITPLGPNFGIKIWNNAETLIRLLLNYLKALYRLPVNFRSFISGYNWQMKRMPYRHYRISETQDDYVFFISSLYVSKPNSAFNTNRNRAAFIRACKKSSIINFEGGLFANKNHPDRAGYEDVLTGQYIQPADYVEKLRRSAVVFNTPAAWGCLGWKLGEFLAMGKAIISTSLLNEMPFQFEHENHVYFADSEHDIHVAVEKITRDKHFRQKLEKGAKEYFESYLAPERVVHRLIK